MFGKLFTTLGARVLGGIASIFAGWVYVQTKGAIIVDPDQVVNIGTDVVKVGGTMIGTYAGTHRILSRFINPGDAAKSRLADAERIAVDSGLVVKPVPPSTTYVAPHRNEI